MGTIMGEIPALFFIYRKSFKNRVKKALRKPLTYVYLVIAILYAAMLVSGFGLIFGRLTVPPASTLAALLTITTFVFLPANLVSYSRRKGLVFRQPDIHFLFSSPVSPKKILLYAHVRSVAASFALCLAVTVGGVLWFSMPVWKMALYFFFSCVVENILEASLMIICYGSERLGKKQILVIRLLMYAVIGAFVLLGILAYVREGASISSVLNYLHSPGIQMIPVIGWNIAFIHLLFMGPTAVNVVCSVLFCLSVAALSAVAFRMKCRGEYFEDAIQFAEDYEIAREKGKKGEVAVIGRKKKYGKATVSYKGSFAKAILYRQLLEYKKNRFFIFGFYTLVCLGLGIGMGVFAYNGDFGDGKFAPFVILGIMAYLTFIFASYPGKWGKELSRPYTYLIPDSAFHKLWYATLIEHVRSFTDGCLLTLPAGIVLGMPLVEMALVIVIYMCLQASKLYAEVMVEAFLGSLFGNVGKQFTRLFFEGIVITVGIIGAVAGTIIASVEVGFLVLIILSLLMTAGMMAVAAVNFERMEAVN